VADNNREARGSSTAPPDKSPVSAAWDLGASDGFFHGEKARDFDGKYWFINHYNPHEYYGNMMGYHRFFLSGWW